MAIWTAFHDFDPLEGLVANPPFIEIMDIVWRARRMLKDRSADQIKGIANQADEYIEEFFESEKQSLINFLIHEKMYDQLETDEDGHVTGLSPIAEAESSYSNSENTTDFEALKQALDSKSSNIFDEEIGIDKFEFFAVLALVRAADIHLDINFEFDFATREYIAKENTKKTEYQLLTASRDTIQAMEAVCYAEQLQNIQQLTKLYGPGMSKAKLDHVRKQMEEDIRKKDKERLAEHLKEGNRKRHEGNNKIRRKVVNDYFSDPSRFKSVDAAGADYSENLKKQNITRSPRVISGWIYEEAKQRGISLRPKRKVKSS